MRTFFTKKRFGKIGRNGWKTNQENLNPNPSKCSDRITIARPSKNHLHRFELPSNIAQEAGIAVPEMSNHLYESHFFLSGPLIQYWSQETQFKLTGKLERAVWSSVKRAKYVSVGKCHGFYVGWLLPATMTSASETFNFATAGQWVKGKSAIVLASSLVHSWPNTRKKIKTRITFAWLKTSMGKILPQDSNTSDLIFDLSDDHLPFE